MAIKINKRHAKLAEAEKTLDKKITAMLANIRRLNENLIAVVRTADRDELFHERVLAEEKMEEYFSRKKWIDEGIRQILDHGEVSEALLKKIDEEI